MGAQPILENGRHDVLAPGRDNDLLLSAGDREIAVIVEFTQVAGVEPAIEESLCGCLRVPPVPEHHLAAADEDLAVRPDTDGRTWQWLAHCADLDRGRRIGGRGGRSLCEAISLEHGEPRTAKEVGQVLAQRSTPGDGVFDPAAE